MPGNPREMITSAERRFPVRIRIAVPPSGLDQRYTQITTCLDENCGSDGWATTPSAPPKRYEPPRATARQRRRAGR